MTYPRDWESDAVTRNGVMYRVRPIRPEDAAREREFFDSLSAESRYNRLMYAMREPSSALIDQLVHVDYHLTMAFVAVIGDGAAEHIVGVARYGADRAGSDCEFAVAVADAWQSRGIGTMLAQLLFEYARARGFRRIYGTVLADNHRMIRLVHWLGLSTHSSPDDASLLIASLDFSREHGHSPERKP